MELYGLVVSRRILVAEGEQLLFGSAELLQTLMGR